VRRPVVIAVDHGGAERMRELWHDLNTFLAFVRGDVLPTVERALGLTPDPTGYFVGGASMGGLASLAALARHPSWIRGAMAMSPSCWFVPKEIRRELALARFEGGSRIYLDVGHRESDRMVLEAERVAGRLARRLPDKQFMWRPDRRGAHREIDWRRRLPKALRFLFRR
jgi:enterochelin esterase-like enzyme